MRLKGTFFARAKRKIQASFANALSFITLKLFKRTSSSVQASTNDLEPLSEMTDGIISVLEATSVAGCVQNLSFFIPSTPPAECYGPQLDYEEHPDGSGGNSGQLPWGDVGMWTATESADGEACAAAKANSLVKKVSDSINGAIEMAASLVCIANVNGESLPSEGQTLDLASTLNTAVSGATISAGSIERLTDVNGNPTYKTTLTGTLTGSGAFNQVLTHTQESESVFSGHLYGYFTYAGGITAGASAVYDMAADGVLSVVTRSGDSAGSGVDFFDGNDLFDFESSSYAQNGYYNLISLETMTGLGTLYSAWTAGSGSEQTRVFRIHTERNAAGADVGYAYFGFGPTFDSGSGLGTISNMICNWAGPSNDHTGLVGMVQGQSIERNSSGIFVPSANYITYAPTNSCNNSAANFLIAIAGQTLEAMGTVTNNLIADDSLGVIPTLTEPTY